MKRIGLWLALLFLTVPITVPERMFAAPHAAPTPHDAQQAAQAAMRSLGAQTTMPGEKESIKEENRKEAKSSPIISEDTARILLYCAIGIGALIVLVTLRDNLWSASRSRRITGSDEEVVVSDAAVARMDQAQVAAEELAHQGSFAEAMHVLLLQSVGEMRQALGVTIAASLTSREILARITLPAVGHEALTDIINRVEISYFGSHQPLAEDFEACRASFTALTAALRTRLTA